MISRQRLGPLLKRAAMSIYQWHTHVVRSSDKTDRRVMVMAPIRRDWSDCIGLYINGDRSVWTEIVVLSPARARALAAHLIEAAERRENTQACKNIDEPY